MFKIGDIVEITASAAATGMLDFKKGKAYEVTGASSTGSTVRVIDESGYADWYHCTHFKLKEDTIVEKKECLFKEGQVVWDLIYREGKVLGIGVYGDTVVEVGFYEDGNLMFTRDYTVDGKVHRNVKRSLFFSEPKIEAATEPLFEPTLKKGDVVAVCSKGTSVGVAMGIVTQETETVVYFDPSDYGYAKEGFDFYRLGEKINFK